MNTAAKAITIYYDGQQFIVIKTDRAIIQDMVNMADIDLKIPDEMKQYLTGRR